LACIQILGLMNYESNDASSCFRRGLFSAICEFLGSKDWVETNVEDNLAARLCVVHNLSRNIFMFRVVLELFQVKIRRAEQFIFANFVKVKYLERESIVQRVDKNALRLIPTGSRCTLLNLGSC